MYSVLVCGGRDFSDSVLEYKVLDSLWDKYKTDLVIISGCARGADSIAIDWADGRKIDCEKFPALWEVHGKTAGHIRNKQMLDEGKPDLVIAFPGGRGTANMIKQARGRGIEVREIKYNG